MGISRNPPLYTAFSVFLNLLISILLVLNLFTVSISPAVAATQIDIIGPPGSGEFGHTVTVLPNGNFVVCDPQYNDGFADVGAVYLYEGSTGDQISMLTGSTSGDFLCSDGVAVLENGNYVVSSPEWNNGAGAVTWANSITGVSGVVDTDNSLVGNKDNDFIGGGGVTALINGNYVVHSPEWDNGSVANAGAVTWGDGTAGITGAVSITNSLVGSTAEDHVGLITALPNGNYVVRSPWWDSPSAENVGAVTWVDGTTGITGTIDATNSLVGSTNNDQVGFYSVTVLKNGNYVVRSPNWDGPATNTGAVTWGDGTTGVTGEINVGNSLVGSTLEDQVGLGVTLLTNDNYVVSSPNWDGSTTNAGAVTWGDGTTGTTGIVNDTNSLVGSNVGDMIGYGTILALSNGNYLVRSINWDNGAAEDTGAVTWGDGTTGITGEVSPSNSLVGSTSVDRVGWSMTELTNSNYVVVSPYWDNGLSIKNAGAVTWGNGETGITGTISSLNSLVGSTIDDRVGIDGALPLFNGNYVVSSPWWDGLNNNTGAVTWGDGTSGITGPVSASNSLVGSTIDDQVGYSGVTALTYGNYVVSSHYWDNGTVADAGAVTWGDGTTGIVGEVSTMNSLVGSADGDFVGNNGAIALSNGNFVVTSIDWNNGSAQDAGAVTWGDGTTGITGAVSPSNSLVGSMDDDRIGSEGVQALDNGNYLVFSTMWDNGANANAGAVTWGDGESGITGVVSAANSLVGSTSDDQVGFGSATLLIDGNYAVVSPHWDHGAINDAGAVTWGDGMSGITGEVNSANSLVGSTSDDWVGEDGVTAMPNGNYVVLSSHWDDDLIVDVGAVSWGDVNLVTTGGVTYDNSVHGTTTDGGSSLNFAYDEVNDQLVVGRREDNIVTLFRPNRLPVAGAGADQTVKSGTSVVLDGSTSYDPDGNLPLTYDWEQSGGPTVTLSSSDTATPSFTAPAVTQTSSLTFKLVVTDSLGMPGTPDEVVITVEPYTALLPMVLNVK